ncbi:hypothetical protein O181_002635 [Austropuccinia psidii MF-1]|uniref:Uncharacterized protein n=1 Tax=Austropuccinia psidii MF-1 TaxID=1389203 RepID=A0A9Q3BCU6_9BASI|nr:hypothetical protein [Austropuccinia psidii MF-1]
MKDITHKVKNPPAQELYFNEAPKETNRLKDVLDQLRELSEALDLPNNLWKDKPKRPGLGLEKTANHSDQEIPRKAYLKMINLIFHKNFIQDHT